MKKLLALFLIPIACWADPPTFQADSFNIQRHEIKEASETVQADGFRLNDFVWFENGEENLVIELATDYHQYFAYNFNSNNIPKVFQSELCYFPDSLGIEEYKDRLPQTKRANPFITKKGFWIGMNINEALNVLPDYYVHNEGEEDTYRWTFQGTKEGRAHPIHPYIRGFGHELILVEKGGKVIGIMMYNGIP